MLSEIQLREGALHASEARLRAIFESALDGVVTVDHSGRIVDCNPAAEELFGYPRGKAVGRRLTDLVGLPGLLEGDGRGSDYDLGKAQGALLQERMELVARNAGGAEFPVEVAFTRVLTIEPPLFTGFIRDITDRKQADREIRQLNAD